MVKILTHTHTFVTSTPTFAKLGREGDRKRGKRQCRQRGGKRGVGIKGGGEVRQVLTLFSSAYAVPINLFTAQA